MQIVMKHVFLFFALSVSGTAVAQDSSDPAQMMRDLDPDLGPGVFRDCAVCPEMKIIPNTTVALGHFEVMRAQFAEFVAATGHQVAPHCEVWDGTAMPAWDRSANGKSWRDPGFAQATDHPVVCIAKADAEAYAAWLSDITGRTYRLPTAAEWDAANRAGTTTAYPWGEDANDACAYANVADAALAAAYPGSPVLACNDTWAATAPAGMHAPNAFGFYDITGNVWEWVADCATTDESGTCLETPVRGGGFRSGAQETRASQDDAKVMSDAQLNLLGFRVAAEVE